MGIRLVRAQGRGSANTVRGFLPYFYAQFRDVDGRLTQRRLDTRLRGVPPESGLVADRGDEAFERSRAIAEQELASLLESMKDPKAALAKGRALIEHGTGRKVSDLPLRQLAAWYRARENVTETDENRNWLAWKDKIISDFADYAARRGVRTVFRVTPELARAYCEGLAREFTHETLKKKTYRLRMAFAAYLAPSGMDNPFSNGFKARKTEDNAETWHEPLNEKQVRALWAYAKANDPQWYGPAVAASCTGLRIGDVCNLKWSGVDFKNGVLTVKTEKTGATVYVPLFDHDRKGKFHNPFFGELRRLLEGLFMERADDEQYVFPFARTVYAGERNAVYSRGKVIMARSLFGNAPEDVDPDRGRATAEEVKRAIATAKWTERKRARIMETYSRLLAGQTAKQIQAETGCCKSLFCTDLADLQHLTGVDLRPRKGGNTVRELVRKTRKERATGVRSACLYGWHSLRAAFVVMAYTAGVPLDIIQQIVGHTCVKMTMRYLHPTELDAAEKFRNAFTASIRGQQAQPASGIDVGKITELLSMIPESQRADVLKTLLAGQAAATVPAIAQ